MLPFRFPKFAAFSWPELRDLLRFVQRRLDQARLQQVAGNLTFVTILALVPLLTIALAVFTMFPQFGTLRESLEAYFVQSMIPKHIASTILGYLTAFAAKARHLSALGAVGLLFGALAMVKMIETSFNQIWRIRQPRPFVQRYLLYLVIAILGPFLLSISLTLTSYIYVASGGKLRHPTFAYSALSTLLSVGWMTCAFTLLYIVLPNRTVRWREGLCGGLVAAIAFEIAKRLFVVFIIKAPTYRMVYGALAAVPIFLLWIYLSWLITLGGAALTAALHFVWYGRWRHQAKPGSIFLDAVEIIRVLYRVQHAGASSGVEATEIRAATGLGMDEIDSLLHAMQQVGWVGSDAQQHNQLDKIRTRRTHCWRLQADPATLTLANVYRAFVFDAPDESALARQVHAAVAQGLNESLAVYFARDNVPA